MPALRIEHVNITVRNPERSTAQLGTIFGWRERWRGSAIGGGTSIHLGAGADGDYVALYTGPAGEQDQRRWTKGVPLNHIGVEVDDLAATEARVIAAGLTPFAHGDYAPGRRFYFFDEDGIEWEVISYA
jgi:catechol 2,3-dioxygenase-like lactoylglutathione lyase family enzyme